MGGEVGWEGWGVGAGPRINSTAGRTQISLGPQHILALGAAGWFLEDAQQDWGRFLFPYALHGATKDEARGLAPGSWFIQACSGHRCVQFEHPGFALVYPSRLSPSV